MNLDEAAGLRGIWDCGSMMACSMVLRCLKFSISGLQCDLSGINLVWIQSLRNTGGRRILVTHGKWQVASANSSSGLISRLWDRSNSETNLLPSK